MTKPKKKTVKKTVVRERYYPDPGKLAVGSAIGAAIGSLVGTALVRRPTLLNEVIEQLGGALTNPEFVSMLSSLGVVGPTSAPVSPPSPSHPAGGCGVPGCPSNNPRAVAEEEARVSQENPTWTHMQVLAEVYKCLDAQIEAAHMGESSKRSRSRKKNSEEPEETPN
jgi:hypothetical protein